MAVFTTRLNLAKPAGGSSGTIPGDDQADIDVINANSDKIDAAIGSVRVTSGAKPATPYDGQTILLTDANNMMQARAGAAWADPGIIGRGTSAHRDAFWGTPGSPAARVAMANLYPYWFNFDKGYMQQYFAQFDDVGVGANTPVRPVHGWGPASELGRVLLDRFTVAINGTGTVTKKGPKVEFVTAQGVLIDGVFSSDFARYELEMSVSAASVATALEMRFRAAGVTDAGNLYSYSFREIATPTESAVGPTTEMIISRAWTGGFILRSVIDSPADAAKRTLMLNHMFDNDTKTRIGGSQYNTAKAFDGIWLDLTGAGTMTGDLRIYGIAS